MANVGKSLTPIKPEDFKRLTEKSEKIGDIPIVQESYEVLPEGVRAFVAEKALLMTPSKVYIVDGSEQQIPELQKELVDSKLLVPLKAYDNNWLVRTDPKDVIDNIEESTWIVTKDRYETECHVADGVKSDFGHWMDPKQCSEELDKRFPNCMTGRTLYVVPFILCPSEAIMSLSGVMLTDSAFVVLMMCTMTRVSPYAWLNIGEESEHVRCIHSVGVPLPTESKIENNWPCNSEKALIVHLMEERQIWSFGLSFGSNALLHKECFGLRLVSREAYRNCWQAEHMSILGIRPPGCREIFVAAAFPSGAGKSCLSMLQSSIPGWSVRCLGCDIAWLKFGLDDRLYAISPENGIFLKAVGTNSTNNPNAIGAISKNTIFINVAETSDGEYFWEGLEKELKNPQIDMVNWEGKKWKIGQEGRGAHPNARLCVPFDQLPNAHPEWDGEQGVPISAIIFGTRRSSGIPLVFEPFSWEHGVFMAASLRTECINDSGETQPKLRHDPMAMGPFLGYNLGKYIQTWLSMDDIGHKIPKIFFVNFFRTDANGKNLWPGFGENIRILAWILKRIDGAKALSRTTAIGNLPSQTAINCPGVEKNMDELFAIDKNFWVQECKETRKFFSEQLGSDLPEALKRQLVEQEKRIDEL
ncbi:unnamed protein product [Thelazia callipaeda]|uniref:phosphoenolpyruvate carboxykinase (GTP) n=1 Tax=Thelazia callipaeda TaxID=103827 RepID=A0A0N5CUL0_THECL|nr:unnamed protein product [Thelazia callipaeda]